MSSPTLLLAHGWAFDRYFWDPLQQELGDYLCATVDLGFYGEPEIPAVTGPVLAVGHSLGFPWLLRHLPEQCIGLVAINAFPRFTASKDFSEGVPRGQVRAMQRDMAKVPARVLADFRAHCGADPSTAGIPHWEKLKEGLNWLRQWDERECLQGLSVPLLALAGESDPIIPPAMSGAAFPIREETELLWHPDGHLLPETVPAWCASHIRAFLSALLAKA